MEIHIEGVPKMVIVVARYNESLVWLKPIPWKYIVYNKGKNNLPKWIKNVVKLPNTGREANTYLTYIVDNYDDLPDYSIFLQGNPFDHCVNLIERISGFKGGQDYFSLNKILVGHNRYGSLTHAGRKVAKSARELFVDDIQFFRFSSGAQFIVSKKAILFHSKTTYQKLLDLMIEEPLPDEVCYYANHGRGGCGPECEHKKRFSAWIMERYWLTLFDSEHKTIYD